MIERIRTVAFQVTLVILTTLTSFSAWSWGHHKDIPLYREGYLVVAAADRGEIRYCFDIHSSVAPRFPDSSMNVQLRMALNVWLGPAILDRLIDPVRLTRVDCSSPSLDLKIEIGPELRWHSMGAYQLPTIANGRRITLIKLNTNYVWNGRRIEDFKRVWKIESDDDLVPILAVLDARGPVTINQVSLEKQLDYESLFWTSYRLFLHELGHSFGLCDTLESMVGSHCDPFFMTTQFEASVMSDSNYLALTKDDEEGILSLFKRHLNRTQ